MVLNRSSVNDAKKRQFLNKDAVLPKVARRVSFSEPTAIDRLRNDPEAAMTMSAYYLDMDNSIKFPDLGKGKPNPIGEAVTIKEGVTENGVTRLIITRRGGTDWYFPYIHVPYGGVGQVFVPIEQPKGTLIVTGAMNGCALQVNRDDKHYIFYHDANSNSLAKLAKLPGNMVCRIVGDSYFDSALIDTLLRESKPFIPAFQMICVRGDGEWKAMCSGIRIELDTSRKPVPGESPIKGSFTPRGGHCLARFDE